MNGVEIAMTDKSKPSEIADADLDAAGGLSPDMKIRKAATSVALDGDVTMGVRAKGIRVGGLGDMGVRVSGVRKRG